MQESGPIAIAGYVDIVEIMAKQLWHSSPFVHVLLISIQLQIDTNDPYIISY